MLTQYKSMINDALDTADTTILNHMRDHLILCADSNIPVLVIGNGGSADIGDHWSCDFTKGISEDTNKKINVRNLGSNMALMTAIANDISYEDVFSKQIEWCQELDALVIAVSSSGSSPNIVKGLKTAKQKGYSTFAFVGFNGGTVLKNNLADYIVHIDANNYGVVEDCHHILMHMLAQDIRKSFSVKGTLKL